VKFKKCPNFISLKQLDYILLFINI